MALTSRELGNMRVQILIEEETPYASHTDRDKHKLWESLSLLHCPFPAMWKQRVCFQLDDGCEIKLGVRFPQCLEFYVDFINNV